MGGYSNNTPRLSEPDEAERMGPYILGKLHETNDPLADGHLGSGECNGREYPKHRPGFLPFHYPRRDGSPSAAKLDNPDRQGVPALAPRKSHGSVTRSPVGKDDVHGAGNHMSTNQYFSLMDNEAYDADDFEEIETMEMEVHPSVEAGDTTLLITEGETNRGSHDLQLTKFQGGPSHPSGMNPHC